jgi:hydrogenase expression/formation protein HypD
MKKELVQKLADRLKSIKLKREIRIMEVCGTHTMEFFKSGVKDFFPEGLTLIDGPGCPVCVTSNEYLDRAIEIGREHRAIITTFGDMIKVPSSYSSLGREKSEGMDVRIVYSPMEALAVAEANPSRQVVFLSVGFETTAPTEAVAVLTAAKKGLKNFSILAGNKLTPPAVAALLEADEVRIDGFIIPGHVSALIGVKPWEFIAEKYGRPGSIAGFETPELLTGTISIVELILAGEKRIVNEYETVVRYGGNEKAQEIMYSVFAGSDATWRGIGVIPASGLALKEQYAEFDAERKLPVTPPEPKEHPGCRCGDLLRGLILPPECPLFGTACSPESAIGPCMVSSEGPCSAYYKYWRK